jgi:hypothetical protein
MSCLDLVIYGEGDFGRTIKFSAKCDLNVGFLFGAEKDCRNDKE